MAGLHFDITGDNSNFMRKLNETRNGVQATSKQIEESGMSIEQMFGRMTKAAAAFGAGFSAQQFVSQVTKVRGEFQQLEVAFNTMLGSKEQADTLMSQLVRTAAITPFDMQGVANGAKQLLAYGTAAEDVNGTLVRLGDIAAGLSIPLNDLVYLYGTTMTQGQLFTMDLRQFQGRGIPLADELAKQFGVTKDKVSELVTAGKVGFPEVQKAIESMTNEGGKFGGLMEAQSKTITGQISNIEDAIATMFNEIGKENESIINSALSGASYLVENWKEVVTVIESAAVAYGTYKAAVMTTAALQGAEQTLKIDAEIEGLQSLLVVKEKSKNADLEAAVASGTLTEAKAVQLASLREELATRLSVLKLKEEEAIAEQASALSAFNTAKQASDTANERLEKMDALYQAALAQGDASYEQYAMEQLQTASANANTASTALNTAEKNLNAVSSKRKAASEAVDTMAMQANTVANHANTASMNIMKLAGIQLTTMLKSMWATLMANPLFLVAGAVTGLAFAIYKVATAETEAEKATRMYNEALDEQQKKQDKYKENIDSLIKAIDDNNKSEGERLQAFEALKAEYPTVLNNLLTEAEYLKEIAKYKKLIAEEDNNRAKQSDEEILEEAKRKLKYYQNERRNGASTTLVDMDGNGWASDNVEDAIKAQQEIVNKAIAKVASHDVSSFLGNIKDMKDNDIVSTISGITTSLQALGKSGDDAIAIVTELGGEFSKAQLSTIKNALETEQKSRSGEKNTGKEWIEKYKNAYLAAKKELDDFLNTENELAEVEYERRLKELTDAKDEAEKKYKNVGGITGSSLIKQENQAKKELEEKIRQQEHLFEQLLSIRRKNQQDEINLMEDGTEKKLAQIDLDYQKELDAIKKQKAEWEKTQGGKLTEEQTSLLGERASNNAKAREKAISAVNKEELEAMNRYLKEYGTFQQKKEAITKEYADKIAKATTEGDKKILQKEMEEAIQGIDMSELKKSMDWEKVFGNLDKVSTNTLKRLKTDLKDFIATQKDLSPENLKELVDAIERIDDKVSERNPFEAMSVSFKSLKKSTDAQREAQEAYNKALKAGTEEEKRNAKSTLESAKNNKQKALSEATTALHKGVDEIGQYVDAGNQVIGIMETLGVKTPEWLGGTMSGFGEILNGLSNIDLTRPMSIVTGSLQTIKGALTSVVSLGGLIPGLGGADYSRYNDMVEEYTRLNEIWDELIDKKLEYINTSYGAEADKVGKEALELVNKSIEAYRILGRERLNSGASAGSHSIGKRMAKNTSSSDWQDIARALDMSVKDAKDFIGTGRMTGLFDLTTEQLEKLKSEAPTFWAKLDGDVRDYLDKIIEGEERIEEIHNQINEQLTQTTFDSVYSNFIDTLMDMKASSKDAAEDISEYFMQAMLSEQIGTLYQDKLKKWYEKFAKGMEDGSLTESERNALNNEYMGYIEEAMKLRDELAAATGYDKISQESYAQSSTSRGFGTEMTHEDAGELSGRFTALQIAGEEVKNAMLSMLAIANTLSVSANSNGAILLEIKNIMVSSNGHLEDIAKYTKGMLSKFGEKLDNINENLKKAI